MSDSNPAPTCIHPTAIVDPAAKLGVGVEIGPYCTVGPSVELGDRCRIVSHAVLDGITHLGPDNVVFPFASIGTQPQALKYAGEPTRLVIGARNTIREHVTMNTGTAFGREQTVVGDDNMFMVGVHIAHDCLVGDGVVMANNATLGGHVDVGDYCVMGGMTAIHQFVRIGDYAMVGGMSGVEGDVIPYGMVFGDRARLNGLNLVGLQRRGFDKQRINALRAAYEQLFESEGVFAERLAHVRKTYAQSADVLRVVDFIASKQNRAICLPG